MSIYKSSTGTYINIKNPETTGKSISFILDLNTGDGTAGFYKTSTEPINSYPVNNTSIGSGATIKNGFVYSTGYNISFINVYIKFSSILIKRPVTIRHILNILHIYATPLLYISK